MRANFNETTKRNDFTQILLSLFLSAVTTSSIWAQAGEPVRVVGAMRNVMWKGELSGSIYLDTLPTKAHLYGMGPLENLEGEILILNGTSYISTVLPDSGIHMQESFCVKAPFFAYSPIAVWKEQSLPDSITTLPQLEAFLDAVTKDHRRPYFFRLEGKITSANFHIKHLPAGTAVHSPEDAHLGQVNYQLGNSEAEILGFFSTEHKTIFTHHDTFLHLHLITADKKQMGHVEDLTFSDGGVRLYLAE